MWTWMVIDLVPEADVVPEDGERCDSRELFKVLYEDDGDTEDLSRAELVMNLIAP